MFNDRLLEGIARVKEEIAQSATYTPVVGAAVALSVVFEEVAVIKNQEQYGQSNQREGRAGFSTADLGYNPAIDATIAVAGATWAIAQIESIEHGWATVICINLSDGLRVKDERISGTGYRRMR